MASPTAVKSLIQRLALGSLATFLGLYLIFACLAGLFIVGMLVASPIAVFMNVAGPLEILIARGELVVSGVLIYLGVLYSL